MSIINDKEMAKEIITDGIENYDLSKKDAEAFAEQFGNEIVSAMWDEYSNIIEQCMYDFKNR